MMAISRGDIWVVNFDPTLGAEIKKTRPAVVFSNDMSNQNSSTVTLLPVTDRGEDVYSFEVDLSKTVTFLKKSSKVKCQQIRTVDKRRLVRFLGILPSQTIHSLEKAVCLHLGIDLQAHM